MLIKDDSQHGFCEQLHLNKSSSKEQSIDFEVQFKFSNVEALMATTKELEEQERKAQEALLQLKAPFVCMRPDVALVDEVDESGCGMLGCT